MQCSAGSAVRHIHIHCRASTLVVLHAHLHLCLLRCVCIVLYLDGAVCIAGGDWCSTGAQRPSSSRDSATIDPKMLTPFTSSVPTRYQHPLREHIVEQGAVVQRAAAKEMDTLQMRVHELEAKVAVLSAQLSQATGNLSLKSQQVKLPRSLNR